MMHNIIKHHEKNAFPIVALKIWAMQCFQISQKKDVYRVNGCQYVKIPEKGSYVKFESIYKLLIPP